MNRLLLLLVIVVGGCNKPSDEACRKAIKNMRSIMGTDSPTNMTDIEGDVRRCKGGSTRKAVECAGKATTIDDLRACEFMKIPGKSGAASGTGSSNGSSMAGSSMSEPMGSDVAGSNGGSNMGGSSGGSMAGSGSSSMTGSAAGSGGSGSSTGSASK